MDKWQQLKRWRKGFWIAFGIWALFFSTPVYDWLRAPLGREGRWLLGGLVLGWMVVSLFGAVIVGVAERSARKKATS